MQVTDALMLGDGKMSEKFTWVGFSSRVPALLAVGTDSGRVMLFSPKSNKLGMRSSDSPPRNQAHCQLFSHSCPEGG